MAEKLLQWCLCRLYGDKKGKGLTAALLGNGAFAALVKQADDDIEGRLNVLALKVIGL